MKTTVSVYDFRESFKRMGRGGQFSYSALGDIFEYLEQYEEGSETELELDVISICCEFSEEPWQDIAKSYDIDLSDCDDDDERLQAVADYLCDQGAYVSHVGDSLVYRQF